MGIRNRASESVPPIVIESPRNRVVQSDVPQNFADLDDKTTADLPVINGPLAAALAAAGTAITELDIQFGGAAKRIISTTAPADTTAIWVDPVTGLSAIYIGGGWVTSSAAGIPANAYTNALGQPYTNLAGQYYLAA